MATVSGYKYDSATMLVVTDAKGVKVRIPTDVKVDVDAVVAGHTKICDANKAYIAQQLASLQMKKPSVMDAKAIGELVLTQVVK